LLQPGDTVIVDGGSTALAFVEAIPPDHTGTFITHSPPVAAALAGARS
jgi:DeoR/GlpR family transcriptional regulator of sugar metabolism